MTATTGKATWAGSAGSLAASAPASPSPETLSLQLGWSMQRLYRARPMPEAARGQLPDRLPGLSGLTRRERAEIDYGRALTCLSAIASALAWTPDQVASLSEVKTRLDAFQLPAGRSGTTASALDGYREAVLDGHLSLITTITAAGAPLGKAYNLGRALADTCRPNQDLASLQQGFEPNRLAQLQHDLGDLASVLPAHSAKAVARSMTWWRDAVYLADDSPAGKDRRRALGSVRTDAPGLRRPPGIANPRISTASPSGDLDVLRRVLPRQGELWRVVLTGEKKPLDLLTPDDYLSAARRAVAGGRRIAARTLLAAPKTTVSLFLLVTGVLAGVLAVIHYSHASNTGKLAAFLIAAAGYLGSLARAAVPRLKSAASAVEQPLWQAALDYVSAEGISLPPVGHPDASGWSRLSATPPPAAAPGPRTAPGPADNPATSATTPPGPADNPAISAATSPGPAAR